MDELVVERAGGVVTLTLNRPERRNAVSVPLWRELARVLAEVAAREEDRVVVLTGAGGHFCAGGDLSGAADGEGAGRWADPAAAMRETVGAACLALHSLPKPTLAAVEGVAAGAGANLALGCDLVLAAESARFAELFVLRALPVDSGGSWLLPRLVGLQRAKELAFFGDFVSAEEARRLGLVNRVLPASQLRGEARAWAERLAALAPPALAAIKAGMNQALGASFEQALDAEAQAVARCVASPEFREAMRAFAARRAPSGGA
jgi:enoyl-CoA hydratase/carnithine racemase